MPEDIVANEERMKVAGEGVKKEEGERSISSAARVSICWRVIAHGSKHISSSMAPARISGDEMV